jgi:hypothetical protein
MPFLGKRTCFLWWLSLTLSFHFRFNCTKILTNIQAMANEWKALPPLGPYYGKDWFIERVGKGAFDPVVNRMPAQAAVARLMQKPPYLETACRSADKGRDRRECIHVVGSICSFGHPERRLD